MNLYLKLITIRERLARAILPIRKDNNILVKLMPQIDLRSVKMKSVEWKRLKKY